MPIDAGCSAVHVVSRTSAAHMEHKRGTPHFAMQVWLLTRVPELQARQDGYWG